MSKSTPWFVYVNRILATIGSGQFTPRDDAITKSVMQKVVTGLMSKSGISGSLAEAFIRNIQCRADEREFTWDGPIVLTRNQKTHARQQGWDKVAIREQSASAPSSANDPLFADVYPQFIRFLSAHHPQAIRDVSAFLGLEAADKLGILDLNEMIWNESNINSITCPLDDMKRASAPDEGAITQGAITPVCDSSSANSAMILSSVDRNPARGSKADRAVLSYYHRDPNSAPSANLEYKGTTYRLVFKNVDAFEELAHTHASKEWYHWYDAEFGSTLRQATRSLPATDPRRACISALHAQSDPKAFKAPAQPEGFVLILRNEAGQVESSVVVIGGEQFNIDLPPFKSNHKEAPLHKGALVIEPTQMAA